MLPGPDIHLKPLVGIIWVGFIALLIMAVFTGKLAVDKALLQLSIFALLYLCWISGVFQLTLSNDFFITSSGAFTKLKGNFIAFGSSFFYIALFLPFFLIDSDSRTLKGICLTVMVILSFFWALAFFKRIRLIEDTAPTKLSSAAQGYAELEGKVLLYDNETARGPSPEMPVMAWYAKQMISSTAGFILEDEKGRCTIDPRNAEVITPNYRYNDHSYKAIYPGETLYVLGYLETLNKHRTEFERNGLISSQVAEWKQNRYSFIDMFDKNQDGKVDESEMSLVRDTATNFIDKKLEHIYQGPATHMISNPADGRPFILSSIHPDKLLKKYKIAFFIHSTIWIYSAILIIAMQV